MTSRKKLIEVALPLDAINKASVREKSIRHGHPSTLHLWWARRPLAACRAVIFSQLVDDPSAWPEHFPTPRDQQKERERLHALLSRLVTWEASTDEAILNAARFEIARSIARNRGEEPPPVEDPEAVLAYLAEHAPPVFDPFCGGGSIPLEAQRLGLRAIASDLNPVAVLITKALVEFPPRFRDLPPVNPDARNEGELAGRRWQGARGLAEDVRFYGRWMREEAERRIGHLYPKIQITPEITATRPDLKPYEGRELTVIAWLWARTVRSPDPAARGAMVPLVSSFMLSTKKGKEAWVEIVRDPEAQDGWRFEVRTRASHGKPPADAKKGTKSSRGANFVCCLTGTPIEPRHIYTEAVSGRMSSRLMSIVAEGDRHRVYSFPNAHHESIAESARPGWSPNVAMPENPRWFSPPLYGLTTFGDLFTPRQLVALNAFADLVVEARERVLEDARAAGLADDDAPLAEGGRGATAYADAVAVYLAFAVSRATDAWSSLTRWRNSVEATRGTFARQALPMVWDFAEANPFSGSCGNWEDASIQWIAKAVSDLPYSGIGDVGHADARVFDPRVRVCISTDPPYYDNVGYADLSDFFYVWLRRMLRGRLPDLFATMQVPKREELVATPYRHGGKEQAEEFFLEGMNRALANMARSSRDDIPAAIFYAFKQRELEQEGVTSTGWATFLEAVLAAGFQVDGTWPMRTERQGRMIEIGSNALASSIVLVCRKRPADAPVASRGEFLRALERELPEAVRELQRSAIAPVDLHQALIGPGMAVFSRFEAVREANDNEMKVKTALALINDRLDAILAEQEGDYDSWTRFAVSWYEQYGFEPGPFGLAETMAKARDVSVAGVAEAGILEARGGKVRLLKPTELPGDWDPKNDDRVVAWEALWHLARRLEQGEAAAAALLADLGELADPVLELAYRVYRIAEGKKRAEDALMVDGLARVFPDLRRQAKALHREAAPAQGELL